MLPVILYLSEAGIRLDCGAMSIFWSLFADRLIYLRLGIVEPNINLFASNAHAPIARHIVRRLTLQVICGCRAFPHHHFLSGFLLATWRDTHSECPVCGHRGEDKMEPP